MPIKRGDCKAKQRDAQSSLFYFPKRIQININIDSDKYKIQNFANEENSVFKCTSPSGFGLIL